MSYTVIDQKTEKHKYIGGVEVETTMSLMNMESEKVGLSYSITYTGGKPVSGGPDEVTGNFTKTVCKKPKVEVKITEFNKKSNYVSLHVNIKVKKTITLTIFNQTLSGNYDYLTGWAVAGPIFESLIEKNV